MVAKKNVKETSPKVAGIAAKLLPNKNIPKNVKPPIASALSQADKKRDQAAKKKK